MSDVEKTGVFANLSVVLARKPAQSATASVAMPASVTGRWLVYCDEQGEGRKLAAQLQKRGDQVILVSRGSEFEAVGPNEYRIAPTSSADHAQIITIFRGINPAGCRGVVYLWGLDAAMDSTASLADVQGAVETACRGALLAAQAIVHSGGLGSGRLSFVTRGAQSLNGEHETLCPAQTALWGFAGVLALEHPELHSRRIDLGSADSAADIVAEVARDSRSGGIKSGGAESGGNETEQFAVRNGSRFTPRLTRSPARDLNFPAQRMAADGIYLITGGFRPGLEDGRVVGRARCSPSGACRPASCQ